jgi:hypothetical protein
MNLVVLQIGWFRMDTYDKPRQVPSSLHGYLDSKIV